MIEKFDYIESEQDADEIIEEFGQVGAIQRTVIKPPPNDWTPGEEVTTYYAIKVVPLPIEEKNIDGTLIKAGDQQALISPKGLTITPEVSDILLINGAFEGGVYTGGQAWMISLLKPLGPAGLVVLYDTVVSR